MKKNFAFHSRIKSSMISAKLKFQKYVISNLLQLNHFKIIVCFLFLFSSIGLLNSQSLCTTYGSNPENFDPITFTNQTINSSNWYENKFITINGTLTINANVVFWNCRFSMSSGSTVIINGGKNATIRYCKIFSCTGLGYGFRPLGNSKLFFKNNEIQNFLRAIWAGYGSYVEITRSTFSNGYFGLVCPIVGDGNVGDKLLLKYEGNTMKTLTNTGISISRISNRLDIGLWNTDLNLFDGCGIAMDLKDVTAFINRTKVINSTNIGISAVFDIAPVNNFVFTGLGKNVETFVNNKNGHIKATGYGQGFVEITQSKFITTNENGDGPDWTGIYIANIRDPFIRIENTTFEGLNINQEESEHFKQFISIIKCNRILDGSTISDNVISITNAINCRALTINDASPQAVPGFKIYNNTVTTSQTNSCIFHLQQTSRFDAYKNIINTQNSPSGPFTLHHDYGFNARFRENTVTDNTKRRWGIWIEASDDYLCGNIVNGCDIGLYVQGPGMDIYDTEMRDNNYGLRVSGVKPQYHTGNHWFGTHYIREAQCHSDPGASRFTADPHNYGQSPIKYWPTTNVTPYWWFPKDTSSPIHCNINPGKFYYLVDTSRHVLLNQAEKWENDIYFYKSMLDDPSLLEDPSNEEYFDYLSSTNLSNIVRVIKGVDELFFLPDTSNEEINSLHFQYDSISALYVDRLSEISEPDTIIIFEDSTIFELTEELNLINTKFDSIFSLNDVTSKLNFLDSLNESIEPENYLEETEINLNRISLLQRSGEQLDTTQIDYLLSIESSCVSDYGLLTARARSLLPFEYSKEGQQDTCSTENLLAQKKDKLDFDNTLVTYNNYNLVLTPEIESKEILLCNVFGQVVIYKLNRNLSDKNVINVENLNSGLWFYRINAENKIFSGCFYKE